MRGSRNEQPEELTPKSRTRSSSATEATKPGFQRKQVISGMPKPHVFAQGTYTFNWHVVFALNF